MTEPAKPRMELYIDRQKWGQDFDFMMVETRIFNGYPQTAVAQPILFKSITPENEFVMSPPLFSLPKVIGEEFLQQIVNQAWDLGIRPRYAKDGQPENTALKSHLDDMRRLVFKDKLVKI